MTAPAVATAVAEAIFDPSRLEAVFAQCFRAQYRTRLCGGAAEPLYQPAAEQGQMHLLWYREDFFASALHETAHWCIAGEQRRQQLDFGYWYAPDGRTAQQQQAFEAVEYQPQALEWFFSRACGYPFRLSADNLGGGEGELPDNRAFRRQVLQQACHWQVQGLPIRARRFFEGLCSEFTTGLAIADLHFNEDQLL